VGPYSVELGPFEFIYIKIKSVLFFIFNYNSVLYKKLLFYNIVMCVKQSWYQRKTIHSV